MLSCLTLLIGNGIVDRVFYCIRFCTLIQPDYHPIFFTLLIPFATNKISTFQNTAYYSWGSCPPPAPDRADLSPDLSLGAGPESPDSPPRRANRLCQCEGLGRFHRDLSTERIWDADRTDTHPCRDPKRILVAAAHVPEAAVGVGNGWETRPQADSRILG